MSQPSKDDWKSSWNDGDTIKKMLTQAEDRLLDSMRSHQASSQRLNVVQKGSTLDQRFETLKAELEKYIHAQLELMRQQVDFGIANRIDHHMGGVYSLLDEMRESIADIRMEWDEFQEDEA